LLNEWTEKAGTPSSPEEINVLMQITEAVDDVYDSMSKLDSEEKMWSHMKNLYILLFLI
jgi:hypothetical protein